ALVLVGGGAAAVNAAAFTAAAPPPTPPQPVPTTVAGVAAPTTAAAETPTPAPTPPPSETLVPAPPPPPPPPEPTAPPEPTRRPDPVVPALTVTADVEVECARWFRDAHRLRVTATGSEPLHTAELHLSGRWHTSLPMEIDGDTARVRTDRLVSRRRYEWWVEVGTESATAATGPREIPPTCGCRPRPGSRGQAAAARQPQPGRRGPAARWVASQASTSSGWRGSAAERLTAPSVVHQMSSSIRIPIPRSSSGTRSSSGWKYSPGSMVKTYPSPIVPLV